MVGDCTSSCTIRVFFWKRTVHEEGTPQNVSIRLLQAYEGEEMTLNLFGDMYEDWHWLEDQSMGGILCKGCARYTAAQQTPHPALLTQHPSHHTSPSPNPSGADISGGWTQPLCYIRRSHQTLD